MSQDILRSMESLPIPEQTYPFFILRPGGNDTCLIQGIVKNPDERKRLNDLIMQRFPNVEQVGFVDLNPQAPRLMMAGGEFCGNATRSTAWLALNGKEGEVMINVSGVDRALRAGVSGNGDAFAQMPVYPSTEKITVQPDATIVELEGITQVITRDNSLINGKTDDEIKQLTQLILAEQGLTQFPAAGVMYLRKNGNNLELTPVVYVRDIDTLFIETACGSGTAAIGVAAALEQGNDVTNLEVVQPSGMPIRVDVQYQNNSMEYVQIRGPIEQVGAGVIETQGGIIEFNKLESLEQLDEYLNASGLRSLYQEIFAEPPYWEIFSDSEVTDLFKQYVTQGQLYIAEDDERTVGFLGIQPIETVSNIEEILIEDGVDTRNLWYVADIGVASQYRRKKIAENLLSVLFQLNNGGRYVMRTTMMNYPSRSLFTKAGFTLIPNVYEQVEKERTNGTTTTDLRLFMIRS